MATVYKAVMRDKDGKFWSFNSSRHSETGIVHLSPGGMEYPIREKVRAPEQLAQQGYHLCAFLKLADAIDLLQDYKNVYIYVSECPDTDVITDLPKYCGPGGPPENLEIGEVDFCDTWPHGTIMCKELTLLEEVSNDIIKANKRPYRSYEE